MSIKNQESLVRATVGIKEAARILGISRQHAYKLAREGKLPGALYLGHRIVVSRKILDDFLNGEWHMQNDTHDQDSRRP